MLDLFPIFLSPLRHQVILKQFLRRDILGRYRGSILGVAWSFITPLLMLGVYSLVFVGVFRARWPGVETAGGSAFSLRLFAGLMVFNLCAEVLSRAPSMVIEHPNLVKKVAFPLELLPFVALGSALFHFLLSTVILLLGCLAVHQYIPMTTLLLPVVVLPLLPLLLGLSWLLSALGVFVRDVAPMISLSISLLMFLSPVFYSVSSLSPRWQFWMRLNPLTGVIENLRAVIFMNASPDWSLWWASALAGVVVAIFGAKIFSLLRDGFADVI